jgi:hypothetical protein
MALTDRGEVLFSPIELITQARENGCTHPDETLRTHIVNYMCINAGSPSAGRFRWSAPTSCLEGNAHVSNRCDVDDFLPSPVNVAAEP